MSARYSVRGTLVRCLVFCLMIRRPPRSTLDRSSAASDVYRDRRGFASGRAGVEAEAERGREAELEVALRAGEALGLSLIHISEPTRPY